MSLSCEEVELSLLEPGRSDAVRAHLSGCEKCQAFERDLGQVEGLAALPELSGAERARLLGLAPGTLSSWRRQETRASVVRRFGGLAVAAGLGALVAGLAVHRREPAPMAQGPVALSDVSLDVPLVLVDDGAVADSDDDVEIAWPNPNEGEAP